MGVVDNRLDGPGRRGQAVSRARRPSFHGHWRHGVRVGRPVAGAPQRKQARRAGRGSASAAGAGACDEVLHRPRDPAAAGRVVSRCRARLRCRCRRAVRRADRRRHAAFGGDCRLVGVGNGTPREPGSRVATGQRRGYPHAACPWRRRLARGVLDASFVYLADHPHGGAFHPHDTWLLYNSSYARGFPHASFTDISSLTAFVEREDIRFLLLRFTHPGSCAPSVLAAQHSGSLGSGYELLGSWPDLYLFEYVPARSRPGRVQGVR